MSEVLGALFKYALQALGIAAVVIVLYAALSTNKAQNTISQTTQLQANIQSLYAGSGNFSSLTNEVAVMAKLSPSDMVKNNALTNAWNGTPTVGHDATTGGFFISQPALPNDACAKVATGISSYLSVQINGGTSYGPTTPLAEGTAALECSDDSNTVRFVFGRA